MRRVLALLTAAALGGAGLALSAPANAEPSELADAGGISVRNGAGMSVAAIRSEGAALDGRARPSGGGLKTNGISAHGGPVMLGATTVHYIWFGNWGATHPARTILANFANDLNGSAYFNVNTTYYSPSGSKVTNGVVLGASTDDASTDTSLTDAEVQAVVSHAIDSGKLGPADPNAVYFVLTAGDVTEESGFGTRYCGWHTYASMSFGGVSTRIKYSFVGNPERWMSACAAQTVGPNGNAAADAMASIVAHELEEAVTDPELNAWYDNRGYENADKCAWTFGSTKSLASGAKYNMTVGARNYLIQQNWVNAAGGYCAMSY